jgi:hypothetical protein
VISYARDGTGLRLVDLPVQARRKKRVQRVVDRLAVNPVLGKPPSSCAQF